MPNLNLQPTSHLTYTGVDTTQLHTIRLTDEIDEWNKHGKEQARENASVVLYLPLLVDDGHCILQLDVIEETGQENIGHTDQAVVLLLIKEWIGALEIGAHHLRTD